MNSRVKLDRSNRILISSRLRKAAGFVHGQTLKVSITPGRIVLETEPAHGKVAKRGALKVWTGPVPSTPLEEAVELVRNYRR